MMDPASDGTETQTQIPPSKSRPPVAKKPKPSVGKKPALSQKPATPPRKPSLNGTDECQHNQEQDLTTPDTCVPNTSEILVNPTPADPALIPSKSITSEKPIIARPKEPPPPLPKTPPKGPVHNKTPPPLPKNPPKGQGGIKATVPVCKLPTSRSTEQINDKISVTLSDSKTNLSNELDEIKTNILNDLTIGNQEKTAEAKPPVIPQVKPKPRRKTIGAVNISSESHISQSALNNQSEDINGNQGKVLEREVSVGNSTWFHASLDDADEQSNSNGPTNESQTDLAKNTQSAAPKRVTSIGKSTFFVESENECYEKNINDIEKKETKSIAEKRKKLSNTKVQKQVTAEKSGSSNHPTPVRTPPPVPKKLTHQKPVTVPNTVKQPELNPGDTSHATNNHNQSYSCDNNEDNKCELVTDGKNASLEASVVECAIKDNTKCAQPRAKPRTSISSTESLDVQPKSVPRKPIPAVKPRPTPKKRSSINRLSGSEQPSPTQTTSGSLDNLSFSLSSKDNTESSVHNLEHKTDAFVDTTSTINAKSDDQKAVTSEQEQEKHYRAIDKSFLGTSNKNTDQTSEKAKNVTTDLSSESFSFVELRKKFKETEKSDAQIDVPKNTNNSHNANIISEKKEENKWSSDHTPSSLKGSFEDILSDKSILEPSSLLTEIEEILSRSYKHSSLTRSGSSPEKKGINLSRDIDFKSERSQSLDLSPEQKTSTPIRPPRPKKEAKRLRSRSQIIYDTCASDTESLPDLSVTGEEQLSSLTDGVAKLKAATLGPAKPHPPKPKRNKLLKVQRSQSDVTKMKSYLDQMETAENKILPNQNQSPNSETTVSTEDINSKSAVGSAQGKTFRAKRPTRKAPPPPCNVKPRTPSVDLNVVVPVDSRVKSINMDKRLSQKDGVEDTAGSIYDSIKDVEVPYSSDEDHDYHEIPDHLKQSTSDSDSRSKSGSPPKLPPRNYSNSNSFDSSSQSGFVCDISVVDTASSVEDLSVSSAVLKTDSGSKTNSPLGKRSQISKPVPSPLLNRKLEEVQNLDKSGLSGSNLSIPESLDDSTGSRTRPVSNASEMMSSSESEGEDEETKAAKKKEKKLFLIAQEVVSSERIFVDVLKLLNVDFRKHISDATENQGRPVIPSETLNRILDYLPQLQNFNEDLLKDLEERLSKWDSKKGIADIFVKKGPFLKLYTSYIRDFETMTSTLDEALKKHPAFQQALKEFEMSPRCACLALKHYMLKPIQRIPQYRLLLLDYNKHLPADSPDMKDMQTALNIVSAVAEHANENMRHGDYVQKMLEIQRSLIGQFEVIKPGRIFLKEGELMKLSRKEMQPRFFFLFNDVLLYTTPVATGYKLNNALPLAGMKVSVSGQDDFKNEFSIVSVQRSFTVAGSTLEERDDWVSALNSAIEENAMKRNTFEAVRAGSQEYEVLLDKDFVLGHKAPIWIPDARVTMCMLCTCEFTVTWRRHHCRACGRVVCGNCSDNKAKLRYLKYKEGRVCDECFRKLDEIKDGKENGPSDQTDASVGKEGDDSWLNIPGLFERFTRLRNSKGADKKMTAHRPKVLTEVTATDQDASMSGYLHKQKGRKWKKEWFVLKDKVLYQYKATQDQAATKSMVLLGYEVVRFTDFYEGVDPGLLFQLSHSNTPPIVFKTDSSAATEKWVTVMREASVA